MMTVSVHTLRQRWGMVRTALQEEARPVLVTRRGRHLAVLLPYETYERLVGPRPDESGAGRLTLPSFPPLPGRNEESDAAGPNHSPEEEACFGKETVHAVR